MIEKKLFYEIKKSADFHSVVMTTFSFDFHHFEMQVLKQIKQKGITNVNLLVDDKMLDESIGLTTGNLKNLNSSYSVSGIAAKGVFHPKMALFVGEKEIMLIQGSGNITAGGHGKNHELFSVLYATEEDKTQLPLLQEAWNYLKSNTVKIKGFSKDKLNWVEENTTLLKTENNTKHLFHQIADTVEVSLLYNDEDSIYSQLINLIPKDSIKKIKILSPFYDENGALLLSLSNHFDGCTIDVYLQENKGLHPHKMEKQKNINFYSWDATERASMEFKKYNRKLHAKLFVFESNERNYCLIGSPNASLKAFGQENYSGANDEFAVLYKYKENDILKDIGVFNKKLKLAPSKPVEADPQGEMVVDKIRIKKIVILGADKEGNKITLFLQNHESYKKVKVKLFSTWGVLIVEQMISKITDKLYFEVNSMIVNDALYLQLYDEHDSIISNKQLLNNVSDLWNTNPSSENRRLVRLTTMIESGDYKLFEVMEYFNTIHSKSSFSKNTNGTTSYSDDDKKQTKNLDYALSYEDAIALDSNSKEHLLILKQHHTIKIWDSFEKYLKEYSRVIEEDNMDDEEEADASTSRDRKDPVSDRKQEYYASRNVLEKRREVVYKFIQNYLKALYNFENYKDKKLGLVDLAMLLIVLKHLFEVTHRKYTIKNETETPAELNYIYHIDGNLSEIGSFSGAILNILGEFINVSLQSEWDEPKDEYTLKKLMHYKNISCINSLFSIALIKLNYKSDSRFTDWFDVTAFNILNVFSAPNEGFEKEIENLINESYIKDISNQSINEIIRKWITKHNDQQIPPQYFNNKNSGICLIRKFIPSQDNPKFLKLSRPGFDYDEKEHDFMNEELFNIESNKWIKSKKSLVNEL
ncbi:hypothetical protein HNQ02_000686 [Flavobacterium sp. 7E]|uniref:phospholipase D-like domain-containing protein n=1 Tax=Flavobacterium sp. 7E TaxID=2735898 RepID=UPI0015703F8E|nr:phospholipase D-like domain-containing protein [Flavobacterium sp. 7E]NRS87779.1 hypothetical protein [Flavobacterium sp. 7E]